MGGGVVRGGRGVSLRTISLPAVSESAPAAKRRSKIIPNDLDDLSLMGRERENTTSE